MILSEHPAKNILVGGVSPYPSEKCDGVNFDDDIPNWMENQISSGWWFQPLWKILVNWDDYSDFLEK